MLLFSRNNKYYFLFLFSFFFFLSSSFSQCISTFPYFEDFETSQGGWTSGGTNNDWTYGTPSKTVITGAGGGIKCWILGGLTASFYKYSEQSSVTSPCYDFTSLTNPIISFLIFWEIERKYDGGNLQYSTNGGSTWTNVGAYGDPVNCMNDHWYNDSAIKFLNTPAWIPVTHGWSGNIQPNSGSCQGGFGSGGWVTAKHCMPYLAGVANVIFRFTAGAGTTCNNYDGLAFDNIKIENAPPNVPSFTSSCGNNGYSFFGAGTPCPTSFSWNFGDTASGAQNISSLQNPTHAFSTGGTFNVTLTANGPCNPSGTITKTITVLNAAITSQQNENCFGGNNGSAKVTASGGTSPYTYLWSNGSTQFILFNLSSATYTVTVTDSAGCSDTASVTITQPPPIAVNIFPSDTIICIGDSALLVASGGGTYLWSTNSTSDTITVSPVTATKYFVTVTLSGCSNTDSVTVDVSPTNAFVSGDTVICKNQFATLAASTGTGYSWSTGATTQSITTAQAGNYFVTITTPCGTAVRGPISVTVNPLPALIVSNDTTIVSGNSVQLTAVAAAASFHWSTGDNAPTITESPTANTTYYVTATNASGCEAVDSVRITIEDAEHFISVPNIFSPNGDGNNDFIKVHGMGIKELKLIIYDRWGEKVFETNCCCTVTCGWDGTFRGKPLNSAVFVYMLDATFTDGKTFTEKGNITLLR